MYLGSTSFQKKVDGKELSKNCISCHHVREKGIPGSLKNIRKKHSLSWIINFIQNPAEFATENIEAKRVLDNGFGHTPFRLSKEDVIEILSYIDSLPDE